MKCDLSESINITDGEYNKNGQFIHKGLTYEPDMFAEFDFIIVNHSERAQVEPHIRGCVCLLKKCVRVCRFCTDDEDADEKCVKTETLTVPTGENIEMEVSLQDNSYAVLTGRTCPNMIFLDPEDDDEDKWVFKVNLFSWN